jgi:hypothetical protein
LEAYHANQFKLRHERKEREAKEAREELARQVAERNRTAGWGNTAGSSPSNLGGWSGA